MKRKINILIPIFAILVLVYVVRSILGPRIQTESLRRVSMEEVVSTKGIMVKYESVIDPGILGALEPSVQEGARVSVGQEVAAVYSGRVDTETKNQLEQVNKKIEQIEKNQANLFSFSNDVSRLEQKITEQTAVLVEKSMAGDLLGAGEAQLVIEMLCEKKAQITGDGAAGNLIEELKAKKKSLEARAGAATRRLYARTAGVFSTAVDGLETVVTPYNMMELTPSAVTELLARNSKEEGESDKVACKIMQNFRYFVAINVPAESVETVKIDDTAGLRFYDLSGDIVPVKILYISPEEEGQKTVIVEGNRYLESLLKRRLVNLEFVKGRHEGYRVSVESLRTKDDVTGVYVRRENMLKFIPVEILYNTEEVVIVASKDEQTPLRLYDEVVVRADSYEEGKLLR
ncbi:MAG: hypothetical protein IKW06_06230 [Clostridia bacterium]|nr:hypothetical protein [Clostridia bacterium]